MHATLTIAQLTAMRVNGVIGARAPRAVAVAIPTALAIRPHRNMEVMNAVTVLRVMNATLTIAQLTAMRVNGVIGARAPKPVAMVFLTAPAI